MCVLILNRIGWSSELDEVKKSFPHYLKVLSRANYQDRDEH